MKKSILLMACCLFVMTSLAHAGHKKGHKGEFNKEEFVQQRVNKLSKELDLTPDQKSKVEAALKAKMDKQEAVHAEMHDKMKKVTDEFHTAMTGILDDKQEEKFDKMRKKGGDMDCCDKCCGRKECPYSKGSDKKK